MKLEIEIEQYPRQSYSHLSIGKTVVHQQTTGNDESAYLMPKQLRGP
jgi:hypothetical protein